MSGSAIPASSRLTTRLSIAVGPHSFEPATMPRMRRMNAAIGTVVFFVLAPRVVAGARPWWLTGWEVGMSRPTVVRAFGAVLTAAGVVVLMQAFARFV